MAQLLELLSGVFKKDPSPSAAADSGATASTSQKVNILVVGVSGAGRRTFIEACHLSELTSHTGKTPNPQTNETFSSSSASKVEKELPATIESSVNVEVACSAGGGLRVVSWNMEQQRGILRGNTAADAESRQVQMAVFQTLESLIGSEEVSCVMAIVDAADKDSWPQVRCGLSLLQTAPFVAAAPLCVVANKEDAQGAAKAPVVARAVGVDDWKPARGKTFTASCSAVQPNGVKDALAIACALSLSRRQPTPIRQSESQCRKSQNSAIGEKERSTEATGRGASNLRNRQQHAADDGDGDGDDDAAVSPEVETEQKKQHKKTNEDEDEDDNDPYAEWLRDAAAKQEAKLAKGATAVQRASRSQYFTALFCLFCALLIRVLIKRFTTAEGRNPQP